MKKTLFITAILIGFLGSAQDSIVKAVSLKGRGPFLVKGSITGTTITGAQIVDSLNLELGSTDWQSGGSSAPFPDNAPIIEDNLDNTKTITMDASNITTGTNRTLSMPDADVDLGNMVTTADVDQDINGRKTFTEGIAITKENSATASIQFLDDDGTTSRGLIGYDVFGNSVSISNITSGNDLILFDSGGLRFDGFSGLGNRMLSVDNDGNIGTSALPTDDQTASEVPITDAGNYFTGTDVEGALQELGASTIPFSGIDKTDDFTIADAEIGQIINIVTNDSIVVTYPDDLSIFGFTKFVVKGTGFVAFDMDALTTTGGSFKTQSGRGESATVRNYSATEADVLNPNQLLAYTPAVGGGLDPPLSGNANPELFVGNSAAFGTDETEGTTGFTQTGGLTSVASTNGYVGSFSIQHVASGNFQARYFDTGETLTSNEVVEWAIVIQGTNGKTARVRININGVDEVNQTINLDGTVQLVTGTASGATGGALLAGVWQETTGDTIVFDMSVKRQ